MKFLEARGSNARFKRIDENLTTFEYERISILQFHEPARAGDPERIINSLSSRPVGQFVQRKKKLQPPLAQVEKVRDPRPVGAIHHHDPLV